ncbi:tyrosine-type recombinase/integrase [Aminivibrio sp.]|uniref:tyrosine-type recombinase/integrase n=1 Tax=Aminivibrio sp. TaxID=1872489 RepID=UPI003D9747DF
MPGKAAPRMRAKSHKNERKTRIKNFEDMLESFSEWRMGNGVTRTTAKANCATVRAFYGHFNQTAWEDEKDTYLEWIEKYPPSSNARNQRMHAMRKFWEWAMETGGRKPGTNYALRATRTVVDKDIQKKLDQFYYWRISEDAVAKKTAKENYIHVRCFYAQHKAAWEKEEDEFRAWILECENPSDKRNQRILSMRKFWEWAEIKNARNSGSNYAATYKLKKTYRIPRAPTREEVQKVLVIMDGIMREKMNEKRSEKWSEKWRTIRNLGVIVLMACTGIRAKELLHLLPEEIDTKKMQIVIPCAKSKNRRERVCPLPNNKYLLQLIKNIKVLHASLVDNKVFKKTSPLLAGLGTGTVHKNSGMPIGTQVIWVWVKKIYHENKIHIRGVHDFRRYYATDYIIGCYERGRNPDVMKLREMLGHKKLETTQNYIDEVTVSLARRNANDYEPGQVALKLITDKTGKLKGKKIMLPEISLSEPINF